MLYTYKFELIVFACFLILFCVAFGVYFIVARKALIYFREKKKKSSDEGNDDIESVTDDSSSTGGQVEMKRIDGAKNRKVRVKSDLDLLLTDQVTTDRNQSNNSIESDENQDNSLKLTSRLE